MKKYVIVAGNIGVGKSTLVSLLSTYLGWSAFYEPVIENPYLTDFYTDMPRWGFHSQVHFLASRVKIHQEIMRRNESVLQDRSIYEDAEIFARNLFLTGSLSERDFSTYQHLYNAFLKNITPPDLMIYLRAQPDTLKARIAQRNRSYESKIASDYLMQLNTLYEEWIGHFGYCPVLTLTADNLDYVAHPAHLTFVAERIMDRLSGVEEVNFRDTEISNFFEE